MQILQGIQYDLIRNLYKIEGVMVMCLAFVTFLMNKVVRKGQNTKPNILYK